MLLIQELNERIGLELAALRRENGLTQEGLLDQIEELYWKRLQELGFSEEEIELYFENNFSDLPDELKKRLRRVGVSKTYHPFSRSYLSDLENGKSKIPAALVEIIKEVIQKM